MFALGRGNPVSSTVDQKDSAVIAYSDVGQKPGDTLEAQIDVKHTRRSCRVPRRERHRARDAISVSFGKHLVERGPSDSRLGNAISEPRPGSDDVRCGFQVFRRLLGAVLRDGYL